MSILNNTSNKIFANSGSVFPITNGGNLENGLKFKGLATNVYIPYNPLICPSAVTLSIWVNVTGNGTSSGVGDYIIYKKNTRPVSQAEGYTLSYEKGPNRFRSLVASSAGTQAQAVTPTISTNKTYHVVTTIDNVSNKIYLNGVLMASTNTGFNLDYDTSTPVVFGSSNFSFSGFLNGYIFDVKIFNKVLDADEVEFLYSSVVGTPRTATSNLQGWWNFGQNSGLTTNDLSSNGFTGTLSAYTSQETATGFPQSGNTVWVRAKSLTAITS